MDLVRQLLLGMHLVAGLTALALFWVPALTRKGSPLHRRAGRGYVAAMSIITVTGFLLAFLFIREGRVDQGLFLCFLGVITGTSLWNGWRVLQVKRPTAYYTRPHVAVASVNILTGLALIAFGISSAKPLFYSFGPVGLIIGGTMLWFALHPPSDPKFWLREHLTGMIGSGIASHVAFLVFGGSRLFGWGQTSYGLLLWLTPVVVGTIAITALNIHYRAKSTAPKPEPVPA